MLNWVLWLQSLAILRLETFGVFILEFWDTCAPMCKVFVKKKLVGVNMLELIG